jgi:class 3 adenylate cyclase
MDDHPCDEASAWTCRQAAHPACSPESPSVQTHAQTFLPGLVEGYLGRQALPTTKELAVVFVDIADSTSTLLHHSPAHVLAIVQRFSALVTDIALAHCGDVKDYEGDGALLYFGSIRQAARAALAIRDALVAQQKASESAVQARVSLNVGEVTIGVIGSAHRRAVALLGPSVHLAARLLKEVPPGGIIAPEAAIARLRQNAPEIAQRFQLWGTCLVVRGFEEECVTAYHIPPATDARDRARATAHSLPLSSHRCS